jgi:hypothetical protein
MADTILLHMDSLCILDEMTELQAGIFIKAIKHYKLTNELPPLDFALKMAITPFINQFARDKVKYQKVVERNAINGAKGGRPPIIHDNPQEPKKPSGLIDNRQEPKKADKDKDNDSDSDKENVITGKPPKQTIDNFSFNQQNFYNSLIPFISIHGKEMIKAFYDYWREPNKSKSKMKFEQEATWDLNLRLQRWSNNDFSKNSKTTVRKLHQADGAAPGSVRSAM